VLFFLSVLAFSKAKITRLESATVDLDQASSETKTLSKWKLLLKW